METELRSLPSVDRLASEPRLKELEAVYPRPFIVDLVRDYLNDVRQAIIQGQPCPPLSQMVESIWNQAQALSQPSPRPVINATGIILHTNLGRAPLSPEARLAMDMAGKGYTNLEFDLESGQRGSRHVHAEALLRRLTGAEAALVVNNNAAALLLALTVLARRKEVIISRGQAVEIGGGVRIPEVMRQSGAKLVEVGTTNCTYASDYEEAISPRTAALLRVHTSNFRVIGFTQSVSLSDLIATAQRHHLIVLDDLGSGCLMDTTRFGLMPEPTVQESIGAGVGLAFFSADKLLGGPQGGVIVGQRLLVDKLRKHPLARAVRIDKVSLAGLVATLIHYVKGEALAKIPVWRLIATPLAQIEERASRWAQALGPLAEVIDGESAVGGGSLPGNTLPTKLLAIRARPRDTRTIQRLAQTLRHQPTPIIPRIEKNTLLLDPRTVLPEEDGTVQHCLELALASPEIARGLLRLA